MMPATSFTWDFRGRRSLRIKGYDYSDPGYYGITICTQGRICRFGDIDGERMRLSPAGLMMLDWWCRIPSRFERVSLGAFVIMPNHLHGIVHMREEQRGTLGVIHTSPAAELEVVDPEPPECS